MKKNQQQKMQRQKQKQNHEEEKKIHTLCDRHTTATGRLIYAIIVLFVYMKTEQEKKTTFHKYRRI